MKSLIKRLLFLKKANQIFNIVTKMKNFEQITPHKYEDIFKDMEKFFNNVNAIYENENCREILKKKLNDSNVLTNLLNKIKYNDCITETQKYNLSKFVYTNLSNTTTIQKIADDFEKILSILKHSPNVIFTSFFKCKEGVYPTIADFETIEDIGIEPRHYYTIFIDPFNRGYTRYTFHDETEKSCIKEALKPKLDENISFQSQFA